MLTLNSSLVNLQSSALAILSDANAVKIIKFKLTGRSNCPWAYYEKADGKRAATFISPKEFVGYKWVNNYSEVVNLATGDRYRVADSYCTCPDFIYRRRKDGTKCKHQQMRAEFVGNLEEKVLALAVDINEKELPTGCWLQRTDNWVTEEYKLHCYTRVLRGSWEVDIATLGYLSKSIKGIAARTRSGDRFFSSTKAAANFLISYSGFVKSEIERLYSEKHLQDCYETEQEEDLDIHVDQSDRRAIRRWITLDDLTAF